MLTPLSKRPDALEAENKRLRDALEIYADEDNWSKTAFIDYDTPDGDEGTYEVELSETTNWNWGVPPGFESRGYWLAQEILDGASVEDLTREDQPPTEHEEFMEAADYFHDMARDESIID